MNFLEQGGSTMRVLPDQRVLFGYRDEESDDETAMIYSLSLFTPSLDPIWSVRHPLSARCVVLGMTLETGEVKMLTVQYLEDTDSMRLLRTRFSGSDGSFLACDTLDRAWGVFPDENSMGKGMATYSLLYSPDSATIAVVQGGYRVGRIERLSRVLMLDPKFNIVEQGEIGSLSSVSSSVMNVLANGNTVATPGIVLDNGGGIYQAAVESDKNLNISYYPAHGAGPVHETYQLDVSAFKPLLDEDDSPMLAHPMLTLTGDGLVVTALVIAKATTGWSFSLELSNSPAQQRTYGLVSIAFPRSTMRPSVRVLHPFDKQFCGRLMNDMDEEELNDMQLSTVVPRPDGSVVVALEHAFTETKINTPSKGTGRIPLARRYTRTCVIDRFAVVHYSADGKVQWTGSIDDDDYGRQAENVLPSVLLACENVRSGETIDFLGGYENALRTISFDAVRDTIIVGRDVAYNDSKLPVMRRNVVWSGPSKMFVVGTALRNSQYTLNMIETTDGTPLFRAVKSGD